MVPEGPDPEAKAESCGETTRRQFLGQMGGAGAGLVLGGLVAAAPGEVPAQASLSPMSKRPMGRRREEAYELRKSRARFHLRQRVAGHPVNGDEARHLNKIASHTKGLPHHDSGEVELTAWAALVRACNSGRPADFDAVPLGGTLRFVCPQAALAFDLEGADSHRLGIPAAPRFDSAEQASEMAELYWLALLRDVPFAGYPTHPLVATACEDLSRFSDFRGPKQAGVVTPATLFRGPWAGDLEGPYLSQFLLRPIPHGAMDVEQRLRLPVPGRDFVLTPEDWLINLDGATTRERIMFDSVPRHLRTGRDLSEWVHRDYPCQAGLHAALILDGLGVQLSPELPYVAGTNQEGFVTFGLPCVIDLMSRSAVSALKAAWFQKWRVHRRLRPEEYAGRVHHFIESNRPYPIPPELLLSEVLARVFTEIGGYFLPLGYPEGCPSHPSYPSGHATFAGATVTVLKALYDESWVLPNPVQPRADGLGLEPYTGPPLTVGGELNKLASNVAIGRNFGGLHWRTDAREGNLLGEEVAINILRDHFHTFNEPFDGFRLTKFDGTAILIR